MMQGISNSCSVVVIVILSERLKKWNNIIKGLLIGWHLEALALFAGASSTRMVQ